jgi:hypothetical protein
MMPGMRAQHGDVVGDVFALAGPTPMLTMVMPLRPAAHQVVAPASAAGAAASAPSSSPGSAGRPARRVTTLPGSTKRVVVAGRVGHRRHARARTNSSM